MLKFITSSRYFVSTLLAAVTGKFNMTAFLNKNFKPIMQAYYKRKYRKEIYKMLTFFYDYQKAGDIHMMDAIKIMTLDNDNWSFEKSAKIFGICVYCGFLGGSNSR